MKKALKNRRGAAMIMVLCVMAMVTALCLSLLYGLAQITANANRRVERLRARQLALSISDTLRDTVLGKDGAVVPGTGDLCDMVQIFLSSDSFAPLHWYTAHLDPGVLPDGCTAVTVSMEKDDLKNPALFDPELPEWIDPTGESNYFGQLDIRVTVTTGSGETDVIYYFESRPDMDQLHYYFRDPDSGKLERLWHREGAYIRSSNEEKLIVTVEAEDGTVQEIEVTDSTVSTETGIVQGTDFQLYNGFEPEIPYKLSWQGEV